MNVSDAENRGDLICIIHKVVHQNIVSLCNHDHYVTRNSLVNNADVSWFSRKRSGRLVPYVSQRDYKDACAACPDFIFIKSGQAIIYPEKFTNHMIVLLNVLYICELSCFNFGVNFSGYTQF